MVSGMEIPSKTDLSDNLVSENHNYVERRRERGRDEGTAGHNIHPNF